MLFIYLNILLQYTVLSKLFVILRWSKRAAACYCTIAAKLLLKLNMMLDSNYPLQPPYYPLSATYIWNIYNSVILFFHPVMLAWTVHSPLARDEGNMLHAFTRFIYKTPRHLVGHIYSIICESEWPWTIWNRTHAPFQDPLILFSHISKEKHLRHRSNNVV